MIELTLNRIVKNDIATIGKLYVNGKEVCDTLEDCDRGLTQDMSLEEINAKKIYGVTAIPSGTYQVIINMSNRFKRLLPLLLNVPGYEAVRIHGGNSAEDTLGCILLGSAINDTTLIRSQIALGLFLSIISPGFNSGEKIMLTIK